MPKPDAKKRVNRNPSTVIDRPFAFSKVKDPITGEYVLKRVVSPQITEEILSTGNATVLEDFYNENEATLTAADKQYLNAKLHTAKKIEKIQKDTLLKIGKGKETSKTKLQTRSDPNPQNPKEKVPYYYSLPNIKTDTLQTSDNGCWSHSMSLVLKSKGIDLSQEEIRAFRPNFRPGMSTKKMSDSRIMLSEKDGVNSPFENADLLLKTLPNHYVEQYTFDTYNNNQLFVDKDLLDTRERLSNLPEAERKKFSENDINKAVQNKQIKLNNDIKLAYLTKVRADMTKIIADSINKERTPVMLNYGGSHFVTITGINTRTGELDIVDSQGNPKTGSTTVKKSLTALINERIGSTFNGNGGISLTVVKELKVPKISDNGEVENNGVVYNADGEVVDIRNIGDANGGFKNGFVEGQYTSALQNFDYTKVKGHAGIQQLEDEYNTYCTVEKYYPQKVYYINDPILKTTASINSRFDAEKNIVLNELDKERSEKPAQQEPAPNTFGALIKFNKDAIKLQKKTEFPNLTCLYATYKYMKSKNISVDQANETPLTAEDKKKIGAIVQKSDPLFKAYIGERNFDKLNPRDMSYIAVHGTPEELFECVGNHCAAVVPISAKRLSAEAKQAMKNEIGLACNQLEGTGTGVNYFGFTRSSNTPKFDNMKNKIREFVGNNKSDSFDAFNLKQTCLDYIKDKYPVRSTPSGRKRFDQTMRILKKLMKPNEFRTLVKDINKARKLTGKYTDPNYLTENSFGLQTGHQVLQTVTSVLSHNPDETAVKEMLSVMIAVHEKSNGDLNNVLINPDAENDQKAQLYDRAKKIRSERAFENIVNQMFPNGVDPQTSGPFLEGYIIQNGGRSLFTSYQNQSQHLQNRSRKL